MERWALRDLLRGLLLVAPLLVPSLAPAAPAAGDSTLSVFETELRVVAPHVRRLRLAHPFVVPGSLVVDVNGRRWREGEDYRLAPLTGEWIPLRPLGDPLAGPVRLLLGYRYVPAPVPPREVLHGIRGRPSPEAAADSLPVAAPAAALPGLPGDLEVRGSKTVRLASGSNRDLTVDQNLRLSIEGHLTERIAVRALLSDDNLPVVPEGNTEQLRDIDRVRVEVTAPAWRAVLGDLVAQSGGTRFADYRRKLQGVALQAGDDTLRVGALAGSPRGRYRTVQFRGEEANQGPYPLRSQGTTGDPLFIVAGSERVILDGEVLTRGADRDYTIDYVQGTITFTYRRPVTADSEIVVEFEEGEGPFARTVTGADAGTSRRLGDRLRASFGVRLLRERDDPERYRSGELTAADRQLLAAAGDDPAAAVTPGITEVPAGEGLYRLEERDGVQVAVYDSLAGDHLVEFYEAGAGLGDYRFDHLTPTGQRVFAYAGPGGGAYRIGRPLPLPSSHSLASLRAGIGDGDSTGLYLEWDTSRLDANILSALDDDDDVGHALSLRLDSGRWRPGSGTWGDVRLRLRHEDLDSRYRPFLLARDLFRYDRWGLGQRARQPGFLEQRDTESDALLRWRGEGRRGGWRLGLSAGRLEHGDDLTAGRAGADLDWRLGRWRGGTIWQVATADDHRDPLDVTRHVREQRLAWNGPWLRPSFRWRLERDRDDAVAGDRAAGSRRRTWTYGLAAAAGARWDWRMAFTRGLADSLRAGAWRRDRDTRTVEVAVVTPAWAGMRLTADGSWRRIERPTAPDQTSRLGKVNLSGRWERLGSDWNLRYRVDQSRATVLDRQVVYVGFRQGDYDQEGRFVGREMGDYQVVTAATDSTIATTEAAADLQWRQDFGFLGRRRLWGAWRSTTNLTARLQSLSDRTGDVLRLSPDLLFDPATTVLGEVDWRQEVELLRHLPRWQLKLRREFRQSLDRRYATHPERRLRRFSQVQVAWNRTSRTTWQLRRQWTDESRSTSETVVVVNRSYLSRARRWELGWSYRPAPGSQLQLNGDRTTRRDDVSGVEQTEHGLAVTAQHRWRRWLVQGRGRWSRVTTNDEDPLHRPYFYPYAGTNAETSLRLGWEPSPRMSLSLSWFGRLRGERGWQHDVRMESTARF